MPQTSQNQRPRFAILGSGRGSNAAALMARFADGWLPAELAVVVSNVAGAGIIDRAAAHGYPAHLIESQPGSRAAHEQQLLDCLAQHRVEHLLLAGYMRLLSSDFIRAFPGVILNIHPSLLPDFPGLHAVAAQWQAACRIVGATVHFVDAGLDSGPHLLSGSIEVRGDEGEAGLSARILTEVEHVIYPRAVQLLLDRLRRQVPLHSPSRTSESPAPPHQGVLR
jgi:phosphoribosylglycinamide formyltransferase-1